MAARKSKASTRRPTKEARRLRAVYARSRAQFTAADLQKFTEVEEGIPFATVLAKLEKIHRGARKQRV